MHHLPRRGLTLSAVAFVATASATILPSAAQARASFFQAPSKNIGCYISASGARCDISKHDWPTPKRPKWCDVDYGGGLGVGKSGRATFICAGDTTLHQGGVLAYGHSRTAGRFTCVSRTSGMRCINRRNGHGFLLSRQVARRF